MDTPSPSLFVPCCDRPAAAAFDAPIVRQDSDSDLDTDRAFPAVPSDRDKLKHREPGHDAGPATSKLRVRGDPGTHSSEGHAASMSTDKTTSWAYCEAYATEDETAFRARERSLALRLDPVTPATAALLTVLASSSRPATVVEVGTGAGVSGLALLRGMPSESVLTTIDTDIRALRAARDTFREAGFETKRTRTISGAASLVLPRLTENAYDMVFIDADVVNTAEYVIEGARLLRHGGMLVVNDALHQDLVPQPAQRQEETVIMRDVVRTLRDEPRLSTAVVPTGTGVLLAVRL